MAAWLNLDELERDLGRAARLTVLTKAGGMRVYVPVPQGVAGSKLAERLGSDIAYWLARQHAGTQLDIPSVTGERRLNAHAALCADVLASQDARKPGSVETPLSDKELAHKHGVTIRWVREVRRTLGASSKSGAKAAGAKMSVDDLPLFANPPAPRKTRKQFPPQKG